MIDRNRKILNNTIVLAVGNFGSKILAYIMVLIYTYYIDTSELGYYDIILTTVSFAQPIALMAFDEGAYRWLVGNENIDKKTIISTCIKAVNITSFCGVIIFALLNIYFSFKYYFLIILYFLSSMLYQMILNAVRGLSNNKLYAESGIINSCLILLSETIGLVCLSMGITALLISKIIANMITIIFIYSQEKIFHGIVKNSFKISLAKDVFKYSAPLIPNQISWWIVNSSDRYIILAFLGASSNGIYSISNKFPTIITTITGIVYFALQEIIIKEYDSSDRDNFYSSVFRNYYIFLFSLIFCAIPSTKLVITWFVNVKYRIAWKYTSFLYFGALFSALSSFLGIGYQISKETKRSVISTILAACINISINILFIKYIGLHAASLSTLISYLLLFIIRFIHSKKYYRLIVNWRQFIILSVLYIIIIAICYYGGIITNMIVFLFSIIALFTLNKSIVLMFIKQKYNR